MPQGFRRHEESPSTPLVGKPERSDDAPRGVVALARNQEEPNGALALEVPELDSGCGREGRELMPVSRDARLGHAPTFRRPGDDDGRRNENSFGLWF